MCAIVLQSRKNCILNMKPGGIQMRLNSLPLSEEVKRAIYNAFKPGDLNPGDESTIDDFDLCNGRGKRRDSTVRGYRNTVLRAPWSLNG